MEAAVKPNMADKSTGGISIQTARILAGMFSRMRRGFGLTSFNGRRNYNEIFGWDKEITPDKMMYMYNRGGIAKRVVDAYPDAVWSRPPVLWAQNDDSWTQEWADFAEDIGLWQAFYRLDKLVGLGEYAIMVIGTDKPGLDTPLTKATRITYLQPYSQVSVKIEAWNRDQTSPDFGKPIMYRVYPDKDPMETGSLGYGNSKGTSIRSSFRVHASRVLHVAGGILEDEVFGQPRMAPSWDLLTDLRKVVGSSAESYWLMANRGMQANVDKEMSLSAEDAAALQDEVQDFMDGFRRFIRTKGVDMKEFKNDVADPKGAFDVLITLIAGTNSIPQRILLGSEAGQLASTQDKANWAERVEEERALHAEPLIIKPFVKRVVGLGIMPPPTTASSLKMLWPDAYRMSPLERGQTSAQSGRVLSYVTKLLESKSEEARSLLNRVEMRALLGLATDNRILSDDPQP